MVSMDPEKLECSVRLTHDKPTYQKVRFMPEIIRKCMAKRGWHDASKRGLENAANIALS
jgi:hypothetical protein